MVSVGLTNDGVGFHAGSRNNRNRLLGEYITYSSRGFSYIQDKMSDDLVMTTVSGVGILLFVNAMYCCVGISGIRSLLRRLDVLEQRLVLQDIHTQVQHVPSPVNGDPV